jgi:hypothetical protein
MWIYTSIPQYIRMAWCLENFGRGQLHCTSLNNTNRWSSELFMMKQHYPSFNVWIQNGRYLTTLYQLKNWKGLSSKQSRSSSRGLQKYLTAGLWADNILNPWYLDHHLRQLVYLLHNNDTFILHAYKLPELSSAHQVRKFKATVPIHAHNNQCTTHTLPTATQGFHPFITERCYRALHYPPSLLNTQVADCIWMYVYRLQINWEIKKKNTLPLQCIVTQTMKGMLLHGITF